MFKSAPAVHLSLGASLLMFAYHAWAEDSAALAARLHASEQSSSLDSADLKPWHLKMTVQLFDDAGKPNGEGTIEEWWAGPDAERREYKTGDYSASEIRKDGKLYRTKDAASPPYRLELLRRQAVHPMPKPAEIDASTPEIRKVNFGKVTLECVMLSHPIEHVQSIPLGLFPTYCLDAGKDVLRASYEFGNQRTLRNDLVLFQGKVIARSIKVASDKGQLANVEVVKLEEDTSANVVFDPETTSLVPEMVHVGSGTIAGSLLHKIDPIYPQSAKERHSQGSVILHAVIGTDGHIHSLNLVKAPDPDLAIAAIAAVRQWTYKPYMLNGQPTDVDTTITVNFTFGP